MKAPDVIRGLLVLAYATLWVGGLASYTALGGPPPGTGWTAPLFLALAAALVFAFSRTADWPWLAAGAGIGFCSELSGVSLGIPFGAYSYTGTLAPSLLGVPIVLAAAWLVLLAYVQQRLSQLDLPPGLRPMAGALWMTLIDLVIDPLAAGPLGYWSWQTGGSYYGIPWTNFAGWFATSLLIFLVVPRRIRPQRGVRWAGLSVVVFFAVIAFALGYLLPGLVGAALVAADLLLQPQSRPAGRGALNAEAA